LISILSAAAVCRTGSSGIQTSGMRGGDLKRGGKGIRNIKIYKVEKSNMPGLKTYLLMKVEALDHKNSNARARIKQWQTKVTRLYSSNSNRTHIAVAPPSTPADIFLFLHRKTSAAISQLPIAHIRHTE